MLAKMRTKTKRMIKSRAAMHYYSCLKTKQVRMQVEAVEGDSSSCPSLRSSVAVAGRYRNLHSCCPEIEMLDY